MKTLNQHIQEKLIINKDYRGANIVTPKSFDELRKIIEQRYEEQGPGTKQNPIDFNDIDVSNLDSFCNDKNRYTGIFEKTKFKYIDISGWDVSNVESMQYMFYRCEKLESVGDISKWNVSKVTDMNSMFHGCKYFNQDISGWNVSNVENMRNMFCDCKSFNQDISKWDVSSVTDTRNMFCDCKSFNQDLSNWDISNLNHLSYILSMFDNCPIKYEYKPKFK